jgi:Tol biopolymer transport system component/DNA-binding winged helix-turn-helix (wHTH) protein
MSVEPREHVGPAARPPISDFRIGTRVVRPRLNRVLTPNATLQLEPKVMRVLLCLTERPGEVVTKEQLFLDVWEGAFVTEDVLTRAVGELRRVFEDDAARPRVIETIRKSGYRLIARVEPTALLPGEFPRAEGAEARRGNPATRVLFAGAALALVAVVLALLMLGRHRATPVGSTRVRPVASLPGNERDPALSPDGTRVAFAWNGGTGENFSLYVQLVDGEAPLRLTRKNGVEDRAPAWSPDGQHLAFTRSTSGDCQILIVSALGSGERSIAPCGDRDYRRLAWSPDGRWLALSRRETGGPLEIQLLSLETLERRVITHPSASILGDTSPAFSPDGRWLAFVRNVTDGVGDLYRVLANGGEPTRLTFDNRDTMGLDWEGDGQRIVFSSSRGGIYSLWRVTASGGEPTWLAGGGTKMKHPSTARTRNAVVFENWIYEVNLWRVPVRPGLSTPDSRPSPSLRLTEANDVWNFEPSVSPEGEHVAFVSTRSGTPEIWVLSRGGADTRKLTAFGGARVETPRWSPDGKRLVFSARREARAELWAVEASGGVPERLTAESSDAVAPSWSRDGQSVDFASRRSGSWQVWKLRLADRDLRPLTTGGGYSSRESPDGRSLFFTKADAPGIWRQDLNGGPASPVWAGLAPEDWANWEIGADGVYFRELCWEHREPALVFLAFGASEPVHLALLPEQGWPGFSVSPDGSWLVYPRVDRHSCDIRLIENAP